MENYVLDTSALFTLRDNEAGASQVARLLRGAERRQAMCYVSFMSFMEFFYCVWRRQGKGFAHKAYLELKMLPCQRVDPDEALLLSAGEIKASYPLSVSDSWIAATAHQYQARLVHKDPEFDPLIKIIDILRLPDKK